MRIVLTTWILGLTFTLSGQVNKFQPNWEIGTQKVLTSSSVEREYENGNLISDTTIYNVGTLMVVEEYKTHYIVEVTYENQALRVVKDLYEKLDKKLTQYRNLELTISTAKDSADIELVNWEESKEFMITSINQMERILSKKAPEVKVFAELLLPPFREVFSSKDNVEAYMLAQIGFMLVPYQNAYETDKPIIETESTENPFNPMLDVSATTTTRLLSFDDVSGTCLFQQEIELDLDEFMKVMQGMMLSISKSFGADKENNAEKAEGINDFEMDIVDTQIIHFNTASSWLEKVISSRILTSTSPKDGTLRKKEVVVTTVVS